MTKADRLRLKDLRTAYRLIGECREIGDDPDGWRMHMLEGLSGMTGAQVAMHMQIHGLGSENETLHAPLACGLIDSTQRALWDDYQSERAYRDDAFHRKYFGNFDGSLRSRTLESVVNAREWGRSRHYNDYVRPCGLYDRITSAAAVTTDPASSVRVLVLHRAAVDGPFPRRSLRLVHLFHHELTVLLARQRLARGAVPHVESLTPQLRRVLACALRGESEKRIARRLGVSPRTVNRHVQRLYQRFGVRSRGELMYRCRDSLPTLGRLED